MPRNQDHLDELLSLLREEASDIGFRAIRSLIDAWPTDGTVSEAVLTAQEEMGGWPDSVRHVNWEHDLKELGRVIAAPSWALVRSLELTQSPAEVVKVLDATHTPIRRIKVFALDDASLQGFAGPASLSHLLAIELQGYDVAPETLREFLFTGLPKGIRTLKLSAFVGDAAWRVAAEFLKSERGIRLDEVALVAYPDFFVRDLAAHFPEGSQTLFEIGVGGDGLSHLEALTESPQFASRLGSLCLGSKRLGDEGVSKLASCQHFHNLEKLELRFNQIGPTGVAALAKAPFASRLKHLDLHWNPLGDEGIAAIPNSDRENLESLVLSKTQCSDAGANALAESTGLGTLTALDLTQNDIGDAGVAAIAESAALAGLRSLRMGYNPFGDSVCPALADARFTNLRELDLSDTRLSPGMLELLANSKSLRELRSLNLTSCDIGDEEAAVLASSSAWTYLQVLDLTSSILGDEGLRAIATSPSLADLRVLNLTGDPGQKRGFGDKGILALAETETLTKLVELNLVCRNISEGAMIRLANSPAMRRLDRVFLYHTGYFQTWLDAPGLRPALRACVKSQMDEAKEQEMEDMEDDD